MTPPDGDRHEPDIAFIAELISARTSPGTTEIAVTAHAQSKCHQNTEKCPT